MDIERGYFHVIQCNPDIRELSGPEKSSLTSGFGLFCLGKTGSNLGPEKNLSYPGLSYPGYTVIY